MTRRLVEPVVATDREHLRKLVHLAIKNNGPRCNLNHIDVSHVNDMSGLFAGRNFDGDLSRWDVSKVQDMNMMFEHTQFHGDVAAWDVRAVKDFRSMFQDSPFDGDLSRWQMHVDAETGFMFGNLPKLLSRESRLALPVIPLKGDMEALFGYKSPAYQAWLTQRPIDANHWRVLMQAVQASEKDTWIWESMDTSLWPHADMLDAWMRMRPVHQGLGLTFLESAQWMMGNTPTFAPHSPSLEGMFA